MAFRIVFAECHDIGGMIETFHEFDWTTAHRIDADMCTGQCSLRFADFNIIQILQVVEIPNHIHSVDGREREEVRLAGN